ncbi:MAG: arginine--tRNA ligase [Candidatus Paceibacterota bacterium]|jgi:arginyl-tRNA synthetase
MLKKEINNLIKQSLKDLAKKQQWQLPKDFDIPLITSFNPAHGDYNTPLALILSKTMKDSPLHLAELISQEIQKQQNKIISKIEILPPGHLNFFLEKSAFQKELKNLIKSSGFIKKQEDSKKSIIIDYSSPNIAKPMHIGHLRSTIIGEALANLYDLCGYKVIRWNYLGDWGTQFGKLITAYKLWGIKTEVEKNPIQTLLTLYQKFHREAKTNPDLEQLAQKEFKKLELGDKENKKLWSWFKKESLKDFQNIYKLLGIKFDVEKGESDFEKDLLPLIESLKKKGFAQKSNGALIISLDHFNLPPALIQKSDEATLYLTRDLATLIFRIKKYHPEKILYVVGNEQDLHFKQLFALAKILGLISKTEVEHIKFGLILDEHKKKFSTREGELITLQEVMEKALEKALKIIKEKHSSWLIQKQKQLAQAIALGALKFNSLKSFRTADIIFDWDQMLDFKGDTSIYLQYIYARFNKILLKAKKIGLGETELLNQEIEINLIKQLLDFSLNIQRSAFEYSPHLLTNYLLSLANLASNYYEKVPILKEENLKRRNAQLLLIKTVTLTLKKGLEILGIEVLKEI